MAKPCDTGTCPFSSCEILETVTDFVTGRKVPDTPAERVRQETERFLVNEKGYSKEDIEVGAEFELDLDGETVKAAADLVLRAGGRRIVVVKCIDGVLSAGERLAVSYGRLMDSYQIPIAVVTNGDDTSVMDTVTGEVMGTDLDAIPSRDELNPEEMEFRAFPEEKIEMEKRVFSAFENLHEAACPYA